MLNRAYVEITNVCNLSCSFCPGTSREKRFMTPGEFVRAVDQLRSVTQYLYFHLMGEPLLHPELPELLSIAGKRGFRVCLTTNGTLLPQRKEELLSASALHKVSVSLHSFEGNNCRGDLESYLSGVWDFCEEASKKGILCALRLWNEGGQDEKNIEILHFISEKQRQNVMKIMPDKGGNRRLRENLFLEQAEKFDWPERDALPQKTEFCHGLRRQIGVLCDGTVVPCCLDSEGTLALGNLLTEDLEAILRTPRARAIYDGFSKRMPAESLCRRCGYARRFNRKD